MGPWTAIGVVAFLMGGLSGLGAVAFYRGRDREIKLQAVGFYADAGLPRHLRNAYFSYPFLAAGCFAGGAAALGVLPGSVGTGLVLLTAAAFAMAFAVMRHVPDLLKPAWFRGEEHQAFPILRGELAFRGERMTLL